MNQSDIDRILQLVAYVQSMNYQTKQVMMDGSNYDHMFATLQSAHKLLPAVVESLRWRPAYPGITYNWTEEAACFDCPCGESDIVLGEGGETVTCDCGITYRLRHYVEADRILSNKP